MDSSFMNAFHDEPLDNNFACWFNDKYSSMDMDMQLTQTLDGILPIQSDDDYNATQKKSLNLLSDCKQQQYFPEIFLDSNAYDDKEIENNNYKIQNSNSTLRVRTDSSSIHDCESHSSDSDDDNDDYDILNDHCEGTNDIMQIGLNIFADKTEQNTNCSETDCLSAIDVKNFDLAEFIIKDDSSLKLTEFANELDTTVSSVTPTKLFDGESEKINILDSDSESESEIIDVETVDTNEIVKTAITPTSINDELELAFNEDITYIDNVKKDPSWCPKRAKKTAAATKESKSKTSVQVKTKRQISNRKHMTSDGKSNVMRDTKNKKNYGKTEENVPKLSLDSRKIYSPKSESANNQKSATPSTITTTATNITIQNSANEAVTKHVNDKNTMLLKPYLLTIQNKRKLNLEEYKQRKSVKNSAKDILPVVQQGALNSKNAKETICDLNEPKSSNVKSSNSMENILSKSCKSNSTVSAIVSTLTSNQTSKIDPITVAKNKVLRMQELKRQRQVKIIDSTVLSKVARVTKLPPLEDIVKLDYSRKTHCKVGTGAKIKNAEQQLQLKSSTQYEEITVVSMGSNTDITIPALNFNKYKCPQSLLKSSVLMYNISHSFQKIKEEASNKTNNLNNSLIASIQNVVLKKTLPAVANSNSNSKNIQTLHGEDKIIMHLDKNRIRQPIITVGTQTDLTPEFPLLPIIKTTTTGPAPARRSRERMRKKSHNYRKHNITNSRSSSGSSLNSSLVSKRSNSVYSNTSTERFRNSDTAAAGGYSSRSTRRHRSSLSSSANSAAEDDERHKRQRRTSYNKRRAKNCSRSDSASSTSSECMYNDTARSRSPRYSHSRSRSKSRSSSITYKRHHDYKRRNYTNSNILEPAVEERRIVYVGRIEPETTKDMLHRKFSPYGSIKQITTHYKDNNMKYGFVTFEHAQDAFVAIDNSTKDPQINMYDVSFGGRRAFCRVSYSDLDNAGINNYHSLVYPNLKPSPTKVEDSFEALLFKVKAKLSAHKPAATKRTTMTNVNVTNNESRI